MCFRGFVEGVHKSESAGPRVGVLIDKRPETIDCQQPPSPSLHPIPGSHLARLRDLTLALNQSTGPILFPDKMHKKGLIMCSAGERGWGVGGEFQVPLAPVDSVLVTALCNCYDLSRPKTDRLSFKQRACGPDSFGKHIIFCGARFFSGFFFRVPGILHRCGYSVGGCLSRVGPGNLWVFRNRWFFFFRFFVGINQ